MAKRLDDLGKALQGVLGGRKKLVQAERKVVRALNRALDRIGYKVVACPRSSSMSTIGVTARSIRPCSANSTILRQLSD